MSLLSLQIPVTGPRRHPNFWLASSKFKGFHKTLIRFKNSLEWLTEAGKHFTYIYQFIKRIRLGQEPPGRRDTESKVRGRGTQSFHALCGHGTSPNTHVFKNPETSHCLRVLTEPALHRHQVLRWLNSISSPSPLLTLWGSGTESSDPLIPWLSLWHPAPP